MARVVVMFSFKTYDGGRGIRVAIKWSSFDV